MSTADPNPDSSEEGLGSGEGNGAVPDLPNVEDRDLGGPGCFSIVLKLLDEDVEWRIPLGPRRYHQPRSPWHFKDPIEEVSKGGDRQISIPSIRPQTRDLIDEETALLGPEGQVDEDEDDIVSMEQERFIQVNQQPLMRKLQEPDTRKRLRKNHLLVLNTLMACTRYGNGICDSQRVMAGLIGLQETHFSNAVTILEELNFLTRIPDREDGFTLMLNPEFFLIAKRIHWLGIQEHYLELREARMKNRLKTQSFKIREQ